MVLDLVEEGVPIGELVSDVVVVERKPILKEQQYLNCTDGPRTAGFIQEVKTTHSWTFSGSLSAAAEAELRPSLLAKAVVDGKVSAEASLTVGAEYSRSKEVKHTNAFDWVVDGCDCETLEMTIDDYFATVSQEYGSRHECEQHVVTASGNTMVIPRDCLRAEGTAVATGDGDERFRIVWGNCPLECESDDDCYAHPKNVPPSDGGPASDQQPVKHTP